MVQIFGVSNQVLIWDVESQPSRHAVLGTTASRPDLVSLMQLTCTAALVVPPPPKKKTHTTDAYSLSQKDKVIPSLVSSCSSGKFMTFSAANLLVSSLVDLNSSVINHSIPCAAGIDRPSGGCGICSCYVLF